MKKSGAKKISVKTKKKEVKKKAGTSLKSLEKTAVKKKQIKSVAPKGKEKKTQAKKRKTEIQIQEKGHKKRKKTELKPEKVGRKAVAKKTITKRTMSKTPAKAPLKTSKKAEAPHKAKEPPKTIKVKKPAKRKRKEKAKKIEKTTKKLSGTPQEKIADRKQEKPKASKPPEILPKKLATSQVKKKKPEKIKKPEKVEQIKVVRETLPRKKLTPQKILEVTQIKKAEILKEAKEVEAVQEFKEIKADAITTGYPPAKVTFPPIPFETLPSEYGENGILLMTVNPYKLYAFWEVRKETLHIFKGKLTVRVYDVTDIDFDSMEANSFLDMTVSERVGKAYVNVSPSKEYIADIGIVYNGIFITIARSPRVSTPGAGGPAEEELLQGIFQNGIRIGY